MSGIKPYKKRGWDKGFFRYLKRHPNIAFGNSTCIIWYCSECKRFTANLHDKYHTHKCINERSRD